MIGNGVTTQCGKMSEEGWKCNLSSKHEGDVHVAVGIGSRVLQVWIQVQEPVQKNLYLKGD